MGRASQAIYQVDAFTDSPFEGNPAAVCVLPGPTDDKWMQNVAAEMNLSETAFLWREEQGYRLRWFTPTIEVDLCGHATLASAHVLWEAGLLAQSEPAIFETRSGRLVAKRETGPDGWITLDFPISKVEPCAAPPKLFQGLGIANAEVYRTSWDYLVVLKTEREVCGIVSDFALLKTIPVRGIIVTAPAEREGIDFVSRFFGPGSGIDEDPVTGSAHCALGPYWQARLDKNPLVGYQASLRGGNVRVHVAGDRVLLGGQAVTVLRGELCF